jgi:hypothetical protein
MEWDGERLTMSVPEAAKVLGLSRGSAFEAVRLAYRKTFARQS